MNSDEKNKIDNWIRVAKAQGVTSYQGYEEVKEKIQSKIFNDEHFETDVSRERYDEMVVYVSEQFEA